MALNRERIAAILGSGDFSAFVGEIENDSFDGKDQPYQLDSDPGKREMAKDTCAFANGAGGYVVIGLRTKASAIHYADVVQELRLLPRGLVNTLQFRDVLNAWIYPPIEGLTVQFCASSADIDRGLVAIEVPPQREDFKPFLIVRSYDGKRHVETMFGYTERKGDANSHLGVADLQRALRSGLHFEQRLTPRLDRIETLLTSRDAALAAEPDAEQALRFLDERIQNALRGGSGGTDT